MTFFPDRKLSLRAGLALVVAFLPAVLGGGMDPVAGTVIGVGVGCLCLFTQSDVKLQGFWKWIFILLAILPLLALLPLGGSDDALWRTRVGEIVPPVKPLLLTPQPWVLLGILPVYWGGLVVAAWFLKVRWGDGERGFIASGAGICWLIVLAIMVCHVRMQIRLPYWDPLTGTGPFGSRNQSGVFFALGVIWNLALAGRALRRDRGVEAMLWLASCAGLAWAVGVNGSRAGMGFSVFGVVAFLMIAGVKKRRPQLTLLGVVLAGFAILAIGYLRVHPSNRIQELMRTDMLDHSFRLRIQKDALDLIGDSPLAGVGMGSFDAVFPFYRSRSASEYRVMHPESDWLGYAAEAGLPALLVALVAVCGVVFASGRQMLQGGSELSIAAVVCLLIVLLHGFVDQSLHSPGMVFPVLLLMSLVLSERPLEEKEGAGVSACWGNRLAGLGLILLSGIAAGSLYRTLPWPDIADGTDYNPDRHLSMEGIERGLQRAPLAWNLRELHGHFLLHAGRTEDALREFRAARILEPHSVYVAHREANAWLNAGAPDIALEAASEAVLRASPATQVPIYQHYLTRAKTFPSLQEKLFQLVPSSADLEAGRLEFYPADQSRMRLHALLDRKGVHFSPLPGARLVEFTSRTFGTEGLEEVRKAHVRIDRKSWELAAGSLASEQHFPEACWIVLHVLSPWPLSREHRDLEVLQTGHAAAPGDLEAACALADFYLRKGEPMSASRVLEPFFSSPDMTPVLAYYRGWILSSTGDSAGAWKFFQDYLKRMHAGNWGSP